MKEIIVDESNLTNFRDTFQAFAGDWGTMTFSQRSSEDTFVKFTVERAIWDSLTEDEKLTLGKFISQHLS